VIKIRERTNDPANLALFCGKTANSKTKAVNETKMKSRIDTEIIC